MGLAEWFTIKSPKERQREQQRYERWAFPYGQPQRQALMAVLQELIPEEDVTTAMAVFLMGREGWRGAPQEEPEELENLTWEQKITRTYWKIHSQLPGRRKKLMSRYIALIEAEETLDQTLNYPTPESLRTRAAELEDILA